MKNLRFLALSALFCLSIFGSVQSALAQLGSLFGRGPEVAEITTEQLKSRLAIENSADPANQNPAERTPPGSNPDSEKVAVEDFVLVDVRSQREIDVSVIPGAIPKDQFEKSPEKYRDKTVIVYCTVGGRSGMYAAKLVTKDPERDVLNYRGSIMAWIGADLPLVTLDGEPTRRVHTYSKHYSVPEGYVQVTGRP